MASDPSVVREIARVCLRRFKADAEKMAVQELFFKAGAAGELEKESRSAGALERFRRRKQRRCSGSGRRASESSDMICPITMARPSEPVLLSDGHIYERCAIDAWLDRSATSPLTREIVARPYVPWQRVEVAHARYALSPP